MGPLQAMLLLVSILVRPAGVEPEAHLLPALALGGNPPCHTFITDRLRASKRCRLIRSVRCDNDSSRPDRIGQSS